MQTKRILIAALSLAAFVAVPAVAALWPNLPKIGGAAYCAGYSTGSTGQVCNVTVPAGPVALQGLETVPMDTNYAQGRAPQTVKAGLASFNALPVTFSAELTPVTATNTLTAAETSGGIIVVGTAALSPTSISLPAAPIDGQEFKLSSNQTINVMYLYATPATISNKPLGLTPSTTLPYGYKFKYRSSDTNWYRLQ